MKNNKKKLLSSTQKFYLILCKEMLLFLFLYTQEWISRQQATKTVRAKVRAKVDNKRVKVVVHEWGGYPSTRMKTIKNAATFTCGLQGQLERFADAEKFYLTISISDAERYTDLDSLKAQYNVIQVANEGMDFSGYSTFYEKIKDCPNSYVILTNSSVNAIQEDFIDSYIDYMEENPDVGLLGVSYCSKMIQTLIRKNFRPHIQSFFLMTTTQVVREIVEYNNKTFPGAGITHKLLLIREGEIRISEITKKLGYNLAVVNPIDGKASKFASYKEWKLPFGDIRQIVEHPNVVRKIVK